MRHPGADRLTVAFVATACHANPSLAGLEPSTCLQFSWRRTCGCPTQSLRTNRDDHLRDPVGLGTEQDARCEEAP
jgi:hypothetical protein